MDWSMTENGQLYIADYTPAELLYDYNDPILSAWYINSRDVITNGIIPRPIGWQPPYPTGKWYINEEVRLTASGIPDRIKWTKPYPASVWYLDDELDHLFNSMIPLPLSAPIPRPGAFENCSNLHFVRIPRSVKKIGDTAFAGTALTVVCISKFCSYLYSSFPEGCEIIYYEDMYDINYEEFIAGLNNFRSTDIIPYDESSDVQPEIP